MWAVQIHSALRLYITFEDTKLMELNVDVARRRQKQILKNGVKCRDRLTNEVGDLLIFIRAVACPVAESKNINYRYNPNAHCQLFCTAATDRQQQVYDKWQTLYTLSFLKMICSVLVRAVPVHFIGKRPLPSVSEPYTLGHLRLPPPYNLITFSLRVMDHKGITSRVTAWNRRPVMVSAATVKFADEPCEQWIAVLK